MCSRHTGVRYCNNHRTFSNHSIIAVVLGSAGRGLLAGRQLFFALKPDRVNALRVDEIGEQS